MKKLISLIVRGSLKNMKTQRIKNRNQKLERNELIKFEEKTNEELTINALPRYTETETFFQGHILKIVDNASYQFTKREIFELEIYKFKCDNERPYIIDCGANIGLSVIYFKHLYPNAEIVAFEPDGKVFNALQFNIGSFQLSNVSLINKACWNEETVLKFYSEGADAGRTATESDMENLIDVKTIRLREFLTEKVDFLKIDIEGAEINVLEDCADLLYNVDNLFVEYHSFHNKIQQLDQLLFILKAAGFRYAIQQHGIVSKNPFIEIQTQLDMDILLNISAFRK